MSDKLTGQALETFLGTAKKRFKQAQEAETRIRQNSLDDLRFRAGQQWPEDIAQGRNLDNRPCLTINRLPQFIKQVTNEQRLNRPAVQVNPVDSGADEETAEILQGLIRHIEYQSDADVAYSTACDYQVTMGFGFFRIVTDYITPDSFDQEIFVRTIKRPFSVYFDPTCQQADYSDAKWCIITENLTHEEYRQKYPKTDLAGLPDFSSIGDNKSGWMQSDTIRVAEYFYVESKERTLCELVDGSTAFRDVLPANTVVKRERTVEVPVVRWCKINSIEIIEETPWAGQWIPVIPVLGDDIDVDGERILSGIVRNAKDPQRMYNYWATAETEMIALAPKAPYIGATGQFEGQEQFWKTANVRNYAYLEYKPLTAGGHPIGAPQRQTYEPPVQAIIGARAQSADDLKATTGIYDAALGARSNEQSGRAIIARQKESDVGNLHYMDNLARAIRHCGRILIDLIPHIYDAARVVRILGEDMTPKTVQINQKFQQGGVDKIYDLTTGRYDVTVSVGPSYTSKRQEAVESMLELTKAYPDMMAVAGDLLVKNMDWPGHQEIAKRLQKMLPPQLQDEDENAPPVPLAAQQQMAQQGQMIEALTQEVDKLTDERNGKLIETQSRERIAAMNNQTALIQTQAQIDSKEAMTLIQSELAAIKHQMDMLNAGETQTAQQQHEREMVAAQPAPTGAK